MDRVTGLVAGFTFIAIGMLPLRAGTILDNGGPNTNNGFYIDGANWTADDFTLGSSATVRGVGFYFQNYQGISGWNLDITYRFLADNSGAPGSVLDSGVGQNLVAVDSGLPWCCGGGNAFLVTFDLQNGFAATGGTRYWLELSGSTGNTTNAAWWVTADPNGTPTGYSNTGSTFNTGQQFAFFLTDTQFGGSQIPEPGSAIMSALGLLALGGLRLRATRVK